MKNRYFIALEFKGTNYHGWQVQPGSISVQEVLTKSLGLKLKEPITILGAGRTDTGVHAKYFMAHFDSLQEGLHNDKNFIFGLNRMLPVDIAVRTIHKVAPKANCRYDAISRTYEYHISRIKSPFNTEFAYYIYGKLDVAKMNTAAKILYEYSDFTSFSKLHTDSKTNICKIMYASWSENNGLLVFTIKADRFLRNMVRAITGTLLDVGKGKISLHDFRRIIESKNRCEAGESIPPHGLFLINIEYPSEIWL